MALDGIMLNCLLTELKEQITGGRIDKVHQPEKDEIHIVIRSRTQNHRILISASPNYPRIHLTKTQKNNPITPPLFCMVLRKHLIGGRILDIEQPDFERVLIITIESRDELGDLSAKKLIIEIMGRHSNIILVDGNGFIIDSVKRVSEEMSRVRQVLPGKTYISPPSQNKQNPLLNDKDSLKSLFEDIDNPNKAARTIMDNFTGISRVSAQEIVHRAINIKSVDLGTIPNDVLMEKMISTFEVYFDRVKAKDFEPSLLRDDTGRPLDILPFPYYQFDLSLQQRFESASEVLEVFYETRDRIDRGRQRSSHLSKVLNTYLDRAHKKRGILLDEYQQAMDSDKYRLFGELITANLYQIPKNAEKVELVNYYDPDGKLVEITLDKHKTPNENAQAYYKKYNKAKNALVMIEKQLKETEVEIQYLETQIDNLEKCTEEEEIEEIRKELENEGYIKMRPRKKETRKSAPSKPYHFISSDGFDIYVGKNNTQNDRLTLRWAEPEDLWLHTKDIPGSHVIVKTHGRELPQQTLLEAAMLAASFSKGKNSSKVPVDYCPRKNVRKPGGAKPGMVIYDNYNTIFVTPKQDKINSLKKG